VGKEENEEGIQLMDLPVT